MQKLGLFKRGILKKETNLIPLYVGTKNWGRQVKYI